MRFLDRVTVTGDTYHGRLDSLDDALAFADAGLPVGQDWHDTWREAGNAQFRGTNSWDEAVTLCREGWPEGRDKMLEINRDLDGAIEWQPAPHVDLDMGGAYPLVPAYCAGSPLYMVNEVDDGTGRAPVMRIATISTASASVSKQRIENFGAAMLAHVDRIEASGRRVELIIIFAAQNADKKSIWEIVAKRANDPLDVERLAFMLAHPSMLRRVALALWSRWKEFNFLGGMMGSPFDPRPHLSSDIVAISGPTHQTDDYATPQGAFDDIQGRLAASPEFDWYQAAYDQAA